MNDGDLDTPFQLNVVRETGHRSYGPDVGPET